ncbi:murein transglycosylase A [Pseudomonadota bacterium]
MRYSLASWPNIPGLILLAFLLPSCSSLVPHSAGIGNEVSWSRLPGWSEDHHAQAWPALLRGCTKLAKKQQNWQKICLEANSLQRPDDISVRKFMETHFTPHRVHAGGWKQQGLITGYYVPTLYGSYSKDNRFRYPIYKRPDDLLIIELSSLYPGLKKKRVRGRVKGRKVVPYFSRSEINGSSNPLEGNELLWVDNAEALFFLHIQGSGRIQLPDGKVIGVGYADQNGHPYVAIGRRLIQMGELEAVDVNLFSIKHWLRTHPDRAEDLFNQNPSYIFFVQRNTPQEGPIGAMNIPLVAERSVAIDPNIIPLGSPIWLDTNLPNGDRTDYRRLTFAQDIGGAIKGAVRADLFWGEGERAEKMAGAMKQKGKIFVLLPNSN